jgi:hypothetical protein
VLDEGQHLEGKLLLRDKGAVFEQAPGEDGEEDLDLVKPGGVLGSKDEAPATKR